VRLTAGTIADLPSGIRRPTYQRAAQKVGIVHFGIGAFHRAHQAAYTDDAMNAGERDWGMIGVSLRSPRVAEQMNPQEGLYTVTERSGDGNATRVIGAVQQVLVASQTPEQVITAIAAPATHIISFTITEKGYCRATDGMIDMALADDSSVFRFLKDGLARRRERALPGLTLLACDNLASNGAQLQRLLDEYLRHHDMELGEWVAEHCTFPSSMVDRIVPATTPVDLDIAQAVLGGQRDAAHVVTEPFCQWVIEDKFAGPRPQWQDHGADLVSDVAPYETAKLRMLNGAHSALAYIGLRAGHEFVHQAIADPRIRPIVERLMRVEAAPSITAAAGQDLGAYADALLARFGNTALGHRLTQIAMDGSQKIPQRWLETLAWNRAAGRECPAILAGLTAWLAHIKGANGPVDDPRASELAHLELGDNPLDSVAKIFGPLSQNGSFSINARLGAAGASH
jgi:fructuronate reductase